MKLKKQLSRKTDQREWYNYNFTIPKEIIEYLGWDKHSGREFDVEISGNKIIIRKK